jgi:hypothetical protein
MLDDLVWGAPHWSRIALAVGVVLTLLVIWNYASGGSRSPVRWLAGLLKLLAVVLLAICLLQPLRSGTRPKPQANLFAILVDNSESMALRASPRAPTRGQQVSALLDPDSAWRVRLAQDFDVRTYAFDARLEHVDAIENLASDGWASSVATSLEQLAGRLKDRPVAGVLLFSDGNLTDAETADRDWSELGFPVYPVLAAGEEQIRDLRIADVSVTQSDFETAPVTVRVVIAADGFANEKVTVRLSDMETGAVIEEQTVRQEKTAAGNVDFPEVSFRFRPIRSGVRFYQAAVFRTADRDVWNTETATSETTFKNNTRLVTVDDSRGPYRVLYVAGRPNWEFKFLQRALQEDAETDLVGLLRIADKEAKFSFRDRDVSSANPLFAGLENDEEETAQRYDEAVLIRLGVRDADELVRGFPRTAEELFAFHAVILDDIEPEFFSQDQLLLLRRFVAARGGGLLLLGGKEAFAGKRFAQSPLGELSPLYPPRDGSLRSLPDSGGALRLELTREGMLQPWARLRDNERAEAERLARMPAFQTLSPTGEAKPGASVLAMVRLPDGRTSPAIVAQRFGKGRTAAIPVGDLWRWSLRREAKPQREAMTRTLRQRELNAAANPAGDDPGRDDPAQAWRQVTRWLVNEAPRQVECRVISSDDPNEPARLITTVNDEAFLPLENATVELEITPPTGRSYTTTAAADFDNPGQYLATHWARDSGGYHVLARVTAEDGSDVGTAQAGWTADPAAAEFRRLSVNRDWLEEVAKASGGEVVDDNALDSFVSSLSSRKVPVTQAWVYPIWHRPWVMLLAILCLCGEWGLRRWKGMP